MIYLVSKNKSLFSPNKYKQIEFDKALNILKPLKLVQADTETEGLDFNTKALLTIQLGNKENQVVFDWTTMSLEERSKLKEYLESDITLLFWNAMFDLCFLYINGIFPYKVLDGMIAEQLIFLGYPRILTPDLYNTLNLEGYEPITENNGFIKHYELSYSLKAAAKRWINLDIDKTVRGKIINEGLTEEVIVYAAGDVMWLEDIKDAQDKELNKQDLQKAYKFECEFLKALAYNKYCGVKLDPIKWREKMNKDLSNLENAKKALDRWLIDNLTEDKISKNVPIKKVISYTPYNDAEYIEFIAEKNRLINMGAKLIKSEGPYSNLGSYLEIWEIPTQNNSYAINLRNKYIFIDRQGDLFNGFNTEPQVSLNWSSSKQVIEIFEYFGIKVETFDKKTKIKKKSIEEKQIAPQADKFPIIKLFLDYQGAAKVVSTYGENWLKAINEKTGRIHPELHVIGTDTSRISSGGGPYKVNVLNLPRDAETRACFIAEKGNLWISADYTGQESAITASTANDSKMIEILNSGGDLHSEVARSCWPDLLGNLSDQEIKKQYKECRQNSKGVEFGIFYGGDDHTLTANKGFSPKEAKRIYENFMKSFEGIKDYQDYCRSEVMRKGYILMNPVVGHRAHIYDYPWLKEIMDKLNDLEFKNYYWEMKKTNPSCDTVRSVTAFNARKSSSERQSINYRIQNRGACAFKLSMIKLFNWIKSNNLLNIVKICVAPYDEINLECPEKMAEEMKDILIKCMVAGGKPFCPRVYLGADAEISDHWVH